MATAGQCEIDIKYDYLTNAADAAQSYKYVIRNVAEKFGKVATMMPKPYCNGCRIWNACKCQFMER